MLLSEGLKVSTLCLLIISKIVSTLCVGDWVIITRIMVVFLGDGWDMLIGIGVAMLAQSSR